MKEQRSQPRTPTTKSGSGVSHAKNEIVGVSGCAGEWDPAPPTTRRIAYTYIRACAKHGYIYALIQVLPSAEGIGAGYPFSVQHSPRPTAARAAGMILLQAADIMGFRV